MSCDAVRKTVSDVPHGVVRGFRPSSLSDGKQSWLQGPKSGLSRGWAPGAAFIVPQARSVWAVTKTTD